MDDKMTALIVHDLKNDLGVLESELSLLKSSPDHARAAQAHAQCAHLREKLIGFLTLYRASTQGLEAHIEAVSPHDFLHGLLRDCLHERNNIALNVDDADAPAIAFFDEHLVGLALNAALHNAVRFASAHITLSCRKNANDLVFSIHDDGPGLGIQEEKPSTGLGMSLCQAVAQAHHNGDRRGHATLENAPHKGAIFTLALP